jgi:hypothetical protein
VSRKTGRSRQQQKAPAAPAPKPFGGRAAARRPQAERTTVLPIVKRVVWWGATLLLFWVTWTWLQRQVTWYLAVDQFGYLNFARDLLHGRVFHEWKVLESIGTFMPERTDMLAQTYVYDHGRLYCRYSPGFPILLAGWIGCFGEEGAHFLNPSVYMTLLAVLVAFQWRAFRSPWRAGVGATLITLFPNYMHYWGLTLTRDLSAHLFGFIGLFLMLPGRGRRLLSGRTLAAGLALGFAITIRPDAVLYTIPAALMAVLRWWHERPGAGAVGRAMATGVLGVLIGTAPFLAFNWSATGNPFLPTQGMELPLLPSLTPEKKKPEAPAADAVVPPATETTPKVGYPPAGWRGGTHEQVQGGGLRISHMATTLPGNWRILNTAYSPVLIGVALWGAVVAAILRPVLATGAISYSVLAFLFFSCWPRADHRYLVGVFIFIAVLIVEGTFGTLDLVRLLLRRRQREVARAIGVGAALLLAGGTWASWSGLNPKTDLPTLVPIVALGTAAAALAATTGRRVSGVAAMAMMLALVGLKVSSVDADSGRRAPFQRPQMLQARANMSRYLEPNSVVVTSEDVGRPAENIEWYSQRADALYLTDLTRWRLPLDRAMGSMLARGVRPYLYVAANQRDKDEILAKLRAKYFVVDKVADIPPDQAMAYFVAAPFHRGLRMELYRVSNPILEQIHKEHPELIPPYAPATS